MSKLHGIIVFRENGRGGVSTNGRTVRHLR